MWSDPGVRRVVLARFISRVGGEAAFFVGIWGKAAFELDATPAELALVMAALGIASLIGSAIAGVLVDRFDPRRVLIVAEVIFVPVALAMILADSVAALALTTFFLGVVGAPVFTAIASFGPYLTDDENRLAKVNGWIEGASWAAFVVGPGLGALIVANSNTDLIFVLDAVTSAAAALLILNVRLRKMVKPERVTTGLEELRSGFRYAYGHDRLRFYIWVGSSVWVLFGVFSALEPFFYRDVLEVEIETLGWVNSIFGLGLISGTWVAGRLPPRLRSARMLTLVIGLNALGVVAYVGTDMLSVVVAAGVAWGLVIGVMAPLHRTLIQVNTPDHLVGRIMGVNHIHSEVGHLLPLMVAPVLAAELGVQPTLLSAGGIVLLVALAFWRRAGTLDRTRTVDVPRPGLPDPSDEPRSVSH